MAISEMLVTCACAATLVGWYNDLQGDVGDKNSLVIAIRAAAQKTHLSDASITATSGAPMWLMTLKSWSKRIKDAFECDNPEGVS